MSGGVIAVIGHVDHGKTSLVHALTGIVTDRLKEEHERGLSISLGFAHAHTPAGVLNFIDAPGHHNFLRTTVSGLSGAASILVAVSAVEGVMPQTIEHLQVARFLGIENAVFALTKTDLLEPQDRISAERALRQYLSGTSYGESPIVSCSANSGEGLNELLSKLSGLSANAELASHPGRPFLAIDRVFSIEGSGTVATGTLLGGGIASGDELSAQPHQTKAIVKGLQVNGDDVANAEAGSRVALNLRGFSAHDLRKGDVLVSKGAFGSSTFFDAVIELSPDLKKPIKHMDHVQLLIGTSALSAKVRMYDWFEAQRDEPVFVQLALDRLGVTFAGQRFVLQHPSTSAIIGGGKILDPQAKRSSGRRDQRLKVLEAVKQGDVCSIARALSHSGRGAFRLEDLERVSNLSGDEVRAIIEDEFIITPASSVLDKRYVAEAETDYIKTLSDVHEDRPVAPHHPKQTIRQRLRNVPEVIIDAAEFGLAHSGQIVLSDRSVSLIGWDSVSRMSSAQRVRLESLEADLKKRGLNAIRLTADQDQDELDIYELLLHFGKVVRLQNHALRQVLVLHADRVSAAHNDLRTAFPRSTTFTTGEARETLVTSRRVIVPLLEYFDQMGWTVRDGDQRSFDEM